MTTIPAIRTASGIAPAVFSQAGDSVAILWLWRKSWPICFPRKHSQHKAIFPIDQLSGRVIGRNILRRGIDSNFPPVTSKLGLLEGE